MTEAEIIEAGFKKQEVLNEESNNGYDYYYYKLNICDELTLVSSDSVDVVDNEWFIICFDIPILKIKTKEELNRFIDVIRVISGCDV